MTARSWNHWLLSLKEKLLSLMVRSTCTAKGNGNGAPEIADKPS